MISGGDKTSGTYRLLKKIHTFKRIWTRTVRSGRGNDIINDQANSQLIMIIPKEALAGLLTKQEYESLSPSLSFSVHATVAH